MLIAHEPTLTCVTFLVFCSQPTNQQIISSQSVHISVTSHGNVSVPQMSLSWKSQHRAESLPMLSDVYGSQRCVEQLLLLLHLLHPSNVWLPVSCLSATVPPWQNTFQRLLVEAAEGCCLSLHYTPPSAGRCGCSCFRREARSSPLSSAAELAVTRSEVYLFISQHGCFCRTDLMMVWLLLLLTSLRRFSLCHFFVAASWTFVQ